MKFLQKPKKSLGQNFLTDKNIIRKNEEIRKISKKQTILEIGPGLGSLTQEIIESGFSSIPVQCDVTQSSQVKELFDKTEKKFGRVDILVNNAGQIAEAGAVPEKITDDMFEQTVKVNLMGLWFCCREAGQRMLSDGLGGSIINLSSVCLLYTSDAADE
mgnify:CR=1 FL=1